MTISTFAPFRTPRVAAQPFSGNSKVGFLSTYPPTRCGLATFTAALADGLCATGTDVGVVQIADGKPSADARVLGQLVNGSASSVAACVELLNQYHVAIVQHEYGIYGGADGDEVLDVLEGLSVPSIVIVHTVLRHPTEHQRSVLESVAAAADQVVVMSAAAGRLLQTGFKVDPRKVTVIPHGATLPRNLSPSARFGRQTLLTWGLLGPGKGVERVIDVMGALQGLPGGPRYLVAGRTHPKVLARDGEAYREAGQERALRQGLEKSVHFDSNYRGPAALAALIQSASVVVLPYDSTDQVTSGVLVDAIASGRPVVATAFPHAVELLDSGAGIVVGHNDPDALESALRSVLTQPRLSGAMAAEARRLAPEMAWSVVGKTYMNLAQRLITARRAVR